MRFLCLARQFTHRRDTRLAVDAWKGAHVTVLAGTWGISRRLVLRKTVAELEKRGHRAKAIDLPGHGEDQTPLTKVTLGTMVDKIVVEMAGLPGQVVLVGHSLGGIAISVTGETVPERWVAENRTLLEVKVTFGGDHHLSSDIHRS